MGASGFMKTTWLCDMEIAYLLIPSDVYCHIPLWYISTGELSRPWQTEMNLDVAIWSGISFNRLHFMVMRPVPCRSMCTYPLSVTHRIVAHTNTRSQTNTRPPTLIKALSVPIAPPPSITLSLTCRFITVLRCGVCLPPSTCVSSLMRFGGSLSDASVCLDIKESDGLMLTAP